MNLLCDCEHMSFSYFQYLLWLCSLEGKFISLQMTNVYTVIKQHVFGEGLETALLRTNADAESSGRRIAAAYRAEITDASRRLWS